MTNSNESRNDMKFLYDNDKNSYSIELFQDFVSHCPSQMIDGEETTAFPDNYGGAYIDDNGVLHFKIVTSPDDAIKSDANNYISALKKSSNVVDANNDIVVEDAEVTLKQLIETQNALNSVMEDFSISSTYTDEEKNTLVISLLDTSNKDDIIAYLKKTIDNFNSKSVTFEQGETLNFTAANASNNALAGSGASSSTELATLGFNAYNASSGKYGVVTAAHFATSGTTIYNALGYTIGKPSNRQFSGSIDAAFIPFGTNISPSDKINQLSSPNDTLTGYYSNSSIVQGMSTTKVGLSSGVTQGTVTSTSVSFTVAGTSLTNQFKVSNTQLEGDSGGPVFHALVGPLQPGEIRSNTLIGIVTVADSSNNGYGSKAANIMSVLNISLY